jgi:hypothetical protein
VTKAEGHQSDGGFKQSGWNIIFAAVNGVSGNFPLELKHVKSKYSNLNRIWKLWEAHEKSCISGWTRRDDGALVNDTEVEDDYFSKYKDRRRFRRKAPRHLDEMVEVFGDRVASGGAAIGLDEMIGKGPEETAEDTEGDSQTEAERDERSKPHQSQPVQNSTQGQPAQNSTTRQSKKEKTKVSQSLSLRKRAASNSVTPRAKKTTSSTRELAVGLLDTNKTLKKLGNRVGRIIEGITPIERAMKLLKDEIPELGFRNKMKVSKKLDQGNNAAIFCSLVQEERREWVKDIIPELDASTEHEEADSGDLAGYHGDVDLDDL